MNTQSIQKNTLLRSIRFLLGGIVGTLLCTLLYTDGAKAQNSEPTLEETVAFINSVINCEFGENVIHDPGSCRLSISSPPACDATFSYSYSSKAFLTRSGSVRWRHRMAAINQIGQFKDSTRWYVKVTADFVIKERYTFRHNGYKDGEDSRISSYNFRVDPQEMAERVTKALQHTITLCNSADPF